VTNLQLYHGKNNLYSGVMMIYALYSTNTPAFAVVQYHLNNSSHIDMSLHLKILSYIKPIIWSYSLKLHISIKGQAANTNCIVFPLIPRFTILDGITPREIFSVRVIIFYVTFNTISVISWWAVVLVEETGVLGKKPPTCRKSLTKFFK